MWMRGGEDDVAGGRQDVDHAPHRGSRNGLMSGAHAMMPYTPELCRLRASVEMVVATARHSVRLKVPPIRVACGKLHRSSWGHSGKPFLAGGDTDRRKQT